MPASPHSDALRLSTSRPLRLVLVALGTLFVLLGLLGVVLPLLPTTPFLILAASCYARASQRCYLRLMTSPLFGPVLRQWQQERTIPRRAKVAAIVLLTATLGSSLLFCIKTPALQGVLALVGLGVVVFLLRLPSRG